ncbi:hypothetical protein ONE63_001090 [Megalurothrips usitatus]|uniref:Endonuclease/exonuclease/phosphatase domain-containing protein n=1 Tax=Megalurothrips usitatus TaxID=439358 RepID=A0AAV7XF75_9NEOP|nr:hypothetical protein ONE63_001090 [Megalurothrips usitatus]
MQSGMVAGGTAELVSGVPPALRVQTPFRGGLLHFVPLPGPGNRLVEALAHQLTGHPVRRRRRGKRSLGVTTALNIAIIQLRRELADHLRADRRGYAVLLGAAAAERDAADREREAANREREAANRERDAVNAERDAADGERDAANREREAANRERDAVNAVRDAADGERDAANREREAANRERDAVNAVRDAADGERDAANREREAANRERDAVNAVRDAADGERDAAAAWRDATSRERDAAHAEHDAADGEADRVEAFLAALEDGEQTLQLGEETLQACADVRGVAVRLLCPNREGPDVCILPRAGGATRQLRILVDSAPPRIGRAASVLTVTAPRLPLPPPQALLPSPLQPPPPPLRAPGPAAAATADAPRLLPLSLKASAKRPLRLATWNVRSLWRPGAVAELANVLEDRNIHIAALQDVRLPGRALHEVPGTKYLLLSHGHPEQQVNGTAFMVRSCLRHTVRDWSGPGERLSRLDLRGHPGNVSVITAHAPELRSEEADKARFYAGLTALIRSTPRDATLFVLGDFDAQVGREEALKGVCGLESLHAEFCGNGRRLVDLAVREGLVIASTLQYKSAAKKCSWLSGTTRYQVDHVLVHAHARNAITKVQSDTRASIGSDHFMVVTQVQLRYHSTRRDSRSGTERRSRKRRIQGDDGEVQPGAAVRRRMEAETTETAEPAGETTETAQPVWETTETAQAAGETTEIAQTVWETTETSQAAGETTETAQTVWETTETSQPAGDPAA